MTQTIGEALELQHNRARAERGLIPGILPPSKISMAEANRIYTLFLQENPQKLYLIGSLRNEFVPTLAARLRGSCPETDIFDDWYAAGREADDYWKSYEQQRHGTDAAAYVKGLAGHAAGHVFEFDKYHLDTATHALLVLPAGKSGHMELMYAAYGVGADCAILLEPDADPRWDVMYKFIPNIFSRVEEVEEWLQ